MGYFEFHVAETARIRKISHLSSSVFFWQEVVTMGWFNVIPLRALCVPDEAKECWDLRQSKLTSFCGYNGMLLVHKVMKDKRWACDKYIVFKLFTPRWRGICSRNWVQIRYLPTWGVSRRSLFILWSSGLWSINLNTRNCATMTGEHVWRTERSH